MEIKKILKEAIDYKSWKRKNVTLRGIKKFGEANQVYGSLGNGLYTVPLSNRAMARQYGDVYFVVNAVPKNPKIFDGLNGWEIFLRRLKSEALGLNPNDMNDLRDFERKGLTIEDEMMKRGYDGVVIKGREMVNYTPKNVMYFRTEQQLESYFYSQLK
jgi:hypothetical protein